MNDFERGYSFACNQEVAAIAAQLGADYINNVNQAIETLYDSMNAYDYYINTKPAQESLKGFIAEEWASGTANVDAAVKGKPLIMETKNSTALGSIDVGAIKGVDAPSYQLKVYSSPKATIDALGKTLRDAYKSSNTDGSIPFDEWAASKGFSGAKPIDLLYGDQFGLVSSDKLDACKVEAFRRLAKAKVLGKLDEVERWQKVSEGLTDRVRLKNGVESKPLAMEEARRKAIEVTERRKLKPQDDGMTAEQVVKTQNLMNQALKAGATAAAISAALKVAPEIYKAIDYLITEGELDEDSLRAIGAATADGGATGFVNGSATAAITIAAGKGMFGQTIKAALSKPLGSNVIGALVVLVVETSKDAYFVACGKRTVQDLQRNLIQGTYVAVFSLVGAAVGNLIAPGSGVAMIVGSLVGSAVGGLTFSPVQTCVMKVSVEYGFSFFGLIDQDYRLPDDVLDKRGVKTASVKTVEPIRSSIEVEKTKRASVKQARLHTVEYKALSRDLISVNKVGYALG